MQAREDDLIERLRTYFNVNADSVASPSVRDFIKFLYDNNVYIPFIENFKYAGKNWVDEYHDKNCEDYDYLNRAFLWDMSPQGYGYWKSLNEEWREKIERSDRC